MCRITLPQNAVYAWWTTGGKSQLTYTKTFIVPDGVPVKLTAFCNKNGVYENMGTAIFIGLGMQKSDVRLRWPSTTATVRTPDEFAKSGIKLDAEGAKDLALQFREELVAANGIQRAASGFDRKVAIDWQWPFLIPGQNGIPELLVPVPGWEAALCWLQWHALGSLGRERFADCSPSEKWSVVGIALGGVGYLTGYNHEKVDDTSSQFGSMGTGNDCDDFAVAAASVALAAKHTPPTEDSCDLHRWLHDNMADAFVVSGYAWPNKRRDADGNKILVGHMWCELKLNNGQHINVECTSGVAFYGGTSVSSTVRNGTLDEYESREFYWGAQESHTSHYNLPKVKLPEWYYTLVYDAPYTYQDRAFQNPGPPPRGSFVYASVPTRMRVLDNGKILKAKFLPFTTGAVQFLLTPPDNNSSELNAEHGSFQ